MTVIAIALLVVHAGSVVGLSLFAANVLWLSLIFVFLRRIRAQTGSVSQTVTLPSVAVQIPTYNEAHVAGRVIEAVGELDYPKESLHIMVLDDSTDQTVGIVDKAADSLVSRGLSVEVLRRSHREEYKAGALQQALIKTESELVAVFDADFVPRADFLRSLVPALTHDSRIAFVQARWEHLNRSDNVVTKAEALSVDGFSGVYQPGRYLGGYWVSFNGTCGIWRRSAIIDAGGWSGETLTEDIDLAYRAQLKGWKGTFCSDVAVPGELPRDVQAYRDQQARWSRGSLQVARRFLMAVLRAPVSLGTKIQACFHLGHYVLSVLIVLKILGDVTFAALPATSPPPTIRRMTDLVVVASLPAPIILYIIGNRVGGGSWRQLPVTFAALMMLAIGTSWSSGVAALKGMVGRRTGPWIRTPKYGSATPSAKIVLKVMNVELLLAGTCIAVGVRSALMGQTPDPFLLVYAACFGWVGVATMLWRRRE